VPLAAGQSLMHYEILGPLGAGGMGEVYRARDTRLAREVAIKVLPEELAGDEERLRRFEREARTLASLNHPNVAGIHGIDQVGDTCFIAMELVPGEDLAVRLARGPLPVDEAVDVCRQIAEGLEAAHEAGVVHRDLKPANVRLTFEGIVKILDFGLAKPIHPRAAREGTTPAESDSFLVTEEGLVLGTPTYMSPEQACGKPVDRRTDVWSFGCVLYECLTARRAFEGETLSEVLAAVLEREPDLARLPAATPGAVRTLLARCLVKDPRRRLRDLGEARLVLENPGAVPATAAATRRFPWGWLAGLLAVVLGVQLAISSSRSAVEPRKDPVRFRIPPAREILYRASMGEPSPPAISPDGTQVVIPSFTTGGEAPGLFLHTLATEELHALPGTARGDQPFWSPDGLFLAFAADGALRRLRLEGGGIETICELPSRSPGPGGLPGTGALADLLGATWTESGTIVFSFGGTLRVVPADGGSPRVLLRPDEARGELGLWWPRALPGGGLLFAVGSEDPEVRGLQAIALDAPDKRTRLLPEEARAVFASGRLLFARAGALLAQPFDPERLALTGDAVVLSEELVSLPARPSWGWFDASTNGRLVQLAPALDDVQLQWVDRSGRPLEEVGPPGPYGQISLSPDESRVAISVEGRSGSDVWVMDVASGRMVRATSDPGDELFVVWSPKADELAYTSVRDPYTPAGIRRRRLGLDEPSVPLVERSAEAQQWLPDGRLVLTSNWEVWLQPVDEPEGGSRLLGATTKCGEPRYSPDGRWITYIVNESEHEGTLGDWQLYVAPAERPSERTRVSLAGGYQPCWRADGGELIYIRRDGALMSAAIRDRGGRPDVGTPEELFPMTFTRPTLKQYQIQDDAQRILLKLPAPAGRPSSLLVTLDWPALLP